METPTLLKVKDVAAILGISQSSAYRLMQTRIPTVRFGRTVRVHVEDLMRFIELSSIASSPSEIPAPQDDGRFAVCNQEKRQEVWSK